MLPLHTSLQLVSMVLAVCLYAMQDSMLHFIHEAALQPPSRIAGALCLQACLLENVRFHKGETKNDPAFAAALAALADIFVNDAFGVAHRDQSSVTVSPVLEHHSDPWAMQCTDLFIQAVAAYVQQPLLQAMLCLSCFTLSCPDNKSCSSTVHVVMLTQRTTQGIRSTTTCLLGSR